jgi:hypothetical protein
MPKVVVEVAVKEADIEAARAVGAKGSELIEFAIHRCLDEQGVPRAGREVVVSLETIEIELPAGWWM